MAQVINTNIMSLNAQRNLNVSQGSMATSLERLSSGLRINRAKDDAAGLALSAKFETQMRADAMNIRNAGDGISFAQAAEAALAEVQNMAQRVAELTVQKESGLQEASLISLEIVALVSEINAQLGTKFAGNSINSATGITAVSVVVGAGTAVAAATAGGIDEAYIESVAKARASYGAASNRLESKVHYLEASYESNAAAKGRIMDADFAVETANLTRAQILQQAGTAMLAQANALPQNVLSLLR